MIETAGLLIALVLPGLVGFVWLEVLWRRFAGPEPEPEPVRASPLPLLIGYGYLVGMLATTLLMRLFDVLGMGLRFGPIVMVLIVAGAAGLWLRRRHPTIQRPKTARPPATTIAPAPATATALTIAAIAVLGVLILSHVVLAAGEALVRPLFPWDAWASWAQKARVWFELGHMAPFVSSETWPSERLAGKLTVVGHAYPPTIPLIQVWTLLGLGRWDEVAMNLPWVLCMGSLGLALYGQLRWYGLSALGALAAVYLLVSLPLLNTHVALAGYADLWMAATVSLAGMALAQWMRDGDRRQAVLAVILMLAATQIKREGMIWAGVLLLAVLVCTLPRRLVYASGAGLALAIIGIFAAGGVQLEIPFAGLLEISTERLRIPMLGSFRIGVFDTGPAVLENLFLAGNWHLLWYAIACLLVAAWLPRLRGLPGVAAALAITITGLAMVFAAFFLTDLSKWAISATSINRILLHLAPMVIFTLALAVHGLIHSPRPRPE